MDMLAIAAPKSDCVNEAELLLGAIVMGVGEELCDCAVFGVWDVDDDAVLRVVSSAACTSGNRAVTFNEAKSPDVSPLG